MTRHISRRKRNLQTATGIVMFLAILTVVGMIYFWPEAENYIPGEDTEGLTTSLARDLPDEYPRVTFRDVAGPSGITFRHFNGERTFQLPEDMGSGAAWGDFNNDNWVDLFIANFAGPLTMSEEEMQISGARSALYRNDGGFFIEIGSEAGVDLAAWAIGAAWGDYNNDGNADLFVSCYGENVLYRNNGNGTFSNVSLESGIGGYNGFWAGASWGDFDRDGFLDLYVCGYVKYDLDQSGGSSMQYDVEVPASINPSSFAPAENLLFHNNGNGTFSEVAGKSGVADASGRSLSASWCDFDEDGWPDLYVANDVSDNVLFRNRGDNTFEEISHSALVADYRGAMGIGIADWDGDLDLDMFITHWIAQENALYNNLRTQSASLENPITDIRFMDEADRYGLGQIALDFIGFGTSFLDYDNDARPDIYVANGSTFQQKNDPRLLVAMRDQLFWNKGPKEGFFEVSAVSGDIWQKEYVGRGAGTADYDNDGDIDILVVNHSGPALLLRNDQDLENHWMKVSLVGKASNRDAVGAKLRIVTPEGVQIAQTGSQGSYCSQNSLVQHFGLGSATGIDSLFITWPSGTQQLFNDLDIDTFIEITEGEPAPRILKLEK